eukprot:13416748-Alexandrium_andersonii.AAC.1
MHHPGVGGGTATLRCGQESAPNGLGLAGKCSKLLQTASSSWNSHVDMCSYTLGPARLMHWERGFFRMLVISEPLILQQPKAGALAGPVGGA